MAKKKANKAPKDKTSFFNKFKRRRGRIYVSAKEDRTVDGIVFASKLEARAYTYLKTSVGIEHIILQPEFVLQEGFRDVTGKKHQPIKYVADFILTLVDKSTVDYKTDLSKCVLVDSKGMRTDVFALKYKLFMFAYNTQLWLPKTIKDLEELINFYKQTKEQHDKQTGKLEDSNSTSDEGKEINPDQGI